MKKKKILITGGVGFLGTHLVEYLIKKHYNGLVVFDQIESDIATKFDKKVEYFKGDISLEEDVKKVFEKYGPFETVYHLASAMPNKAVSDDVLWRTNITGTYNLISEAVSNHVTSFIFTSSNVAYGIPKTLPAHEETTPLTPLEIYGKSKAKAEKELEKFKGKTNIQIIRCPVITGTGRLGLQAILYEFISENKSVYVLGNGSNKYQFIDADDVCVALEKASHMKGFDIYNIGADEVLSLRDLYGGVIAFAKSKSKIVSLPKGFSLLILNLLDKLNISPLGVYQYTMIGRSLYLDTSKIKKKLQWQPKKTNLDTFVENYKWYIKHKGGFKKIDSGEFSSNRSLPKMGAFALLKKLS